MSERKKTPERLENLETLCEDAGRRLAALESELAGAVPLEESAVVDLDAWEKKWEERYALLSLKQKELEALEARVGRALELLESRRQDFAAAVMPARNWRPPVGAGMNELEGFDGRRPAQNKSSRWVSFLTDLGKKH